MSFSLRFEEMFYKKILPLVFLGLFFQLSSCAPSSMGTRKISSSEITQNIKQESSLLDLKVHKETFANGLKVLIVENHRLPIFSYYTFFDVGSKNEPTGLFGGTHLLEHMLFKGTNKFKEGVFQQLVEEKGGETNAYTMQDTTVYHANLPTDLLPTIIDLESDRMSNLVLGQESFEKERAVVLEERRMRYENAPPARAYQRLLEGMFEGTPYEHAVIGSNSDIAGLKKDEVYTYFKRYYAPNNAIVVIVGDVDVKKTIKFLKAKYESISASSDMDDFKKKANDSKKYLIKGGGGKMIRLHGPNTAGQFYIAYKGEAAGNKRSYVMDILSSVLGDGESSYLVQKYVMGPKPILSSVSVSNLNFKHAGMFYISAEVLDKVTVKVAREKMLNDFRTICTNAVSDRSVQKIKNQYLVSFYEGLKTNAGVASLLGTMERLFDNYDYYKKELELYQSVTPKEVRKVCNEILGSDDWLFVSLWKFNRKENE